MGMNAEILAIGPYNHDVIDALEHDAHRYEGTPAGTTIVPRSSNVRAAPPAANLLEHAGLTLGTSPNTSWMSHLSTSKLLKGSPKASANPALERHSKLWQTPASRSSFCRMAKLIFARELS